MNTYVGPMHQSAAAHHKIPAKTGSGVHITPWGYTVEATQSAGDASPLRLILARFFGAILILAGFGLWLMPNSVNSGDLYSMKIAVTVIFALVGVVLILAGRQKPGHELQVDTAAKEVRLGKRDLSGSFKLLDRLGFDDIASVFVDPAQATSSPSRLYLRLSGGDMAVEVAHGAALAMDDLRQRLLADLGR